jgi:hypothetical protein
MECVTYGEGEGMDRERQPGRGNEVEGTDRVRKKKYYSRFLSIQQKGRIKDERERET